MDLEGKVEAVLFYRSEPVSKKELGSFLNIDNQTLENALNLLNTQLQNRGIQLIITEKEVQLVTASELSDMIDTLRKEELRRDIGKAGAETLAIVLYRGPITRAEIDFIRGVNSTFILRNLLIRGLVERTPHPADKRQYQYAITPSLLAHLGITKKEDLPDYVKILDELDMYEREQSEHKEKEGGSEESLITN